MTAPLTKPLMPLDRRDDGWWITSIPLADCQECGPYRTKDEANEDRYGLRRWFEEATKLGII